MLSNTVLNNLDLRGVSLADAVAQLPRPTVDGDEPVSVVRTIIADVRERGDAALRDYADRFDGGAPDHFRVPADELQAAWNRLPAELRAALEVARDGVHEFHLTQRHAAETHTHAGITVEAIHQPVRRAGCYVPGGRAAYPSTVLMAAIPALVAGVPEVILCVPGTAGVVSDVTLGAAHLAGVHEVYAVGGAQAIAAMAYGTQSIEAVDVIAGPGNVFVAIAKREVAQDVGVAAAFAGPSEIVVVADHTAPPDLAAVDVIVQAEHGPGGLAWLVTWDPAVAESVNASLTQQVADAPRRDDIEATLAQGGWCVLVDDAEAALGIANAIAPEHLQLMVEQPRQLIPLVQNAGAVFLGPLSPASVGDYVAGPSHVLPTNGTARFAGALTVSDFTKDIHVITVSPDGLQQVGQAVVTLAEAEGLAAHADSVRRRMQP